MRLVAATCRVGGPPVNPDQVVLACWHEYNLAAAVAAHRLRRRQRHVSFSTQSFRGVVMSTMLDALDAGSVPLPAEGERAEAARLSRELARLGREGGSPVVAPDGPFGPYRRAKPGALIVAREAALPLQPWAVAASPSWRLRGRWDRHLVPLPFCRLRVMEAEPIAVGPRERLRPLLARLQAALDEVAGRADRGGEDARTPVDGPQSTIGVATMDGGSIADERRRRVPPPQ